MRRYRLTATIVCDEVKFGDTVSTEVERETAPTTDEAIALLQPVAEDAVRFARGEVWPVEFRDVLVIEI
jgi:hypothetical protein